MNAITNHRATILAALERGPLMTKEIIAATGISGSYLGNIIKALMREQLISREEVTIGRWRYYIGQTAPVSQPKPKPAPRPPMRYSIPVRHIEVPRFAELSSNTQASPQTMKITLPAEPWL